jgi:IQ calmodulin-binding motif
MHAMPNLALPMNGKSLLCNVVCTILQCPYQVQMPLRRYTSLETYGVGHLCVHVHGCAPMRERRMAAAARQSRHAATKLQSAFRGFHVRRALQVRYLLLNSACRHCLSNADV